MAPLQAWFHGVNTLGIAAMIGMAIALLVVDLRGRGSRALRVMALFLALRAMVNIATPLQLVWPVDAAFWHHVKTYFLLPLPFVVAVFVWVYPRDRLSRPGLAATTVAAIAVVAAYALRHDWYATIVPAAGRSNAFVAYGPLFHLLGLLYASYVAAGWRFARLWRHERGTLQASLGLVSAGFALNGVYLIALEGAWALTPQSDAFGRQSLVGMAPGIPFALLLVRECWRAASTRIPGARAYLAALLLAPTVAVTEVGLTTLNILPILGYADAVFLLAQPTMLAYALLRHRLFGIDLRLKWTLRHGTTVSMAAAFLLLSDSLGDRWLTATASTALNIAAAGVLLLFVARLQRFSSRLADAALPGVAPTPVYLAARRQLLDVAAAEQTARDGPARHLHPALGSAELATVGATILGHYVLEAPLGRGANTGTWLARDTREDCRVVLKIAGGAGRDGLIREARALARIDHPNVVRVRDVRAVGEEMTLVLDYAEGGSLEQRLARSKMTWPQARSMAQDIAAGLRAIHEAGLIHRDIKPANILFDGEHWLVADLGIAAAIDDQAGGGRLIGSVAYMSPEQAGERPLTPATDWWSLGVVLYRALTGRMPMDTAGLADFDARAAIMEDEPELPIDAPREANKLLANLLHKEPGSRGPVEPG